MARALFAKDSHSGSNFSASNFNKNDWAAKLLRIPKYAGGRAFLDTYRALCLAPTPEVGEIFEQLRTRKTRLRIADQRWRSLFKECATWRRQAHNLKVTDSNPVPATKL